MEDYKELEGVIIRLAEKGKITWEEVARIALAHLDDDDIKWGFGEAGYLDDYYERNPGEPEPPDETNGHEY